MLGSGVTEHWTNILIPQQRDRGCSGNTDISAREGSEGTGLMDVGRCYNTLTPACSQLTSRAVGLSPCLVCCRSCPAPERQTYHWVHVYIRNVHNYANTLTLLPARDCKRESGALPAQTLSRASIESGKAYPAPWELCFSLYVNRGHVTSWPDEVPHAARHGGCC